MNYQIFLFLGSTQIIGTQEGIVTELWSQTASPWISWKQSLTTLSQISWNQSQRLFSKSAGSSP